MALTAEIAKSANVLVWMVALTTISITPWLSYDPINLVKLTVAFTGSCYAYFLIRLSSLDLQMQNHKKAITAIKASLTAILIGSCLTLFFSNAPFWQQFWGAYGRNTGFLYMLSLVIIIYSSLLLASNLELKMKIMSVFHITVIIQIFFGILQIMGIDPSGWSTSEVFGTLGNTNFFSSFLGLAAIFFIYHSVSKTFKTFFYNTLMLLVSLWLIHESGSIQGFFVFGVGFAVLGAVIVLPRYKLFYTVLTSFIFLACSSVVALGTLGLGPLGKFIFQETMSFRLEYWRAGLRMFMENPIFGVGLSTFGDFYRKFRSQENVIEYGPDRFTNSAHNVVIDLAANSGTLVSLGYLSLLVITFVLSIKNIFMSSSSDNYFALLFSMWLAFNVQSFISIGQLGLSVWGWLFTGCLLGSLVGKSNMKEEDNQGKRGNQRVPVNYGNSNLQVSAKNHVLSLFGFLIALCLSLPPLIADARFRSALEGGDVMRLRTSATSFGASSWHAALALNGSLQRADEDSSRFLVDFMLGKNANDYYALRTNLVLKSTSETERRSVFQRLKFLDPWNPDIQLP